MTTAARPTWEPARGGGMKGETDLGKLSKQISTRDLPTQMTLKYRQDGQGNEAEYEDLKVHDYKKDLETRERKAREERNKEKHYKTSGSSAGSIISGAITQGGGSSSSRSRRNIDADDVIDDEDDDSSDEEDETADLLNELNKIKAEREEERKIEEVKKQEEEERIRTENILSGNPLLQNDKKKNTGVKRRWDDDVVFKNCARQEPEKKKNFVNDTIRSDFHRRFMYKYIK